MRHLVKSLVYLSVVMLLFACSADKPADIPEWKSVYFQMMKDTLNEDGNTRGVAVNYGIELYDMDNDGVPELQEYYTRANQPPYHYIWFVENGTAQHILGKYPKALDWDDTEYITGLYLNELSGNLLAEKIYAHHSYESYEYFLRGESKEVWDLNIILSRSRPYGDQTADFEYAYYDAAGTEYKSEAKEYAKMQEQILEGYSLLEGELLDLEDYFPWSQEASKVISDYFDNYDGIPSNVYLL